MAETKKLVLVVDTTGAMSPYWRTILSDYLEKIIRNFCGDNTTIRASPIVEMALICFSARNSPFGLCMIQKGGWIKSVDYFMDWLTSINFSGSGGSCDAAIAEGLAEILQMCPPVHGFQDRRNVGLQKHCILVAASDPYPLPTPVYIPPACIRMPSHGPFSDAETVATYFKQCLVSLSVISPRQLPKLRAIYNAGKRNPSAIDPIVDIVKNPNDIVLISEDFMEARVALCQPEITNLPSNQEPSTISSIAALSRLLGRENIANIITGRSMTTSSLPIVQTMPTDMEIDNVATNVGPPQETSTYELAELATLPWTSMQSLMIDDNVATNVGSAQETSTFELGESALLPWTSMQSFMIDDNVATNVGPAQETSNALQSEESPKFVKLWEGDLTVTSESQGSSVVITRLQGYKDTKDSELHANDWPSTIQVDRLLPQDYQIKEIYDGKVDCVFLRANNKHNFLKRMNEMKLCSVVKLPSKIMLLYSSEDNPCKLVGMLLSQDKVIFEEKISKKRGRGQDSLRIMDI